MMATLCFNIPKEDNQKPQMEEGSRRKDIKKDIQGSTNTTQEN